jgi:hypothetical protein
MRLFKLLLAFLCLAGISAAAAAQTAEERAQLAWIVERGRLIFDLDRAAWVGTDDLLERMPNPGDAGVRGYVVERDGSGYVLTFFGLPEDSPVAYYRGRIENGRVVSREIFPADRRPPLTVLQRRLVSVRGIVGQLDRRPCGDRPFNTAIIPPQTENGPIDIYLLTPRMARDAYPFGGHYRFTIAADGSVTSSREFARSCLTINSRQGLPPGATPVGIAVTHLLDPIPTEIHVFTALSSGLDVFVGTRDRNWEVSGTRIRLVEQPAATGKR